jgi:hypothetical protein
MRTLVPAFSLWSEPAATGKRLIAGEDGTKATPTVKKTIFEEYFGNCGSYIRIVKVFVPNQVKQKTPARP